MEYLTKGSLWRKWDLQIHAPGAKHADQYKSEGNADVWDTFLNYLKRSDVEVFGITDYFSIESYEKILDKTKNNQNFKNKVFFPNIELRLDINTNKDSEEVNVHLIFDNNCSLEKIRQFLSNLKTTATRDDNTSYSCSPADLKELGPEKASVSLENVKKALKETFGRNKPYMTVGSYKGYGGFNYGQPVKRGESERKKILSDEVDKFCDFIFGQERDKEWFLKSDRYESKDITSPKKPVISTSDCHSFEDCRKHLGQESYMTWIKADKTFEGLKQILFEPTDRVCLGGYSVPENKKLYYVIDKVRFIDNSQEMNFLPYTIEINKNLTTIIGGKSTGKSLLLYYIAKTIDRDAVTHSPKKYEFDEISDLNFEVVWADGGKTYLKSSEDSPSEKRKIIYIPQNYLNKLSETDIKSKATLNKFVKDVLLQDENIKTNYDKNNSEVRKLLQIIQLNITTVFQLRQEISEIQENIKKYGEEKGINKYLEQLKKISDEIKNKSGLSEMEIQKYESLLKRGKGLKTELSILNEDRKTILLFRSEVMKNIDNVESLCAEQLSSLENIEIKNKLEEIPEIFRNTENKIGILIKNVILFIDNKIKSKTKNIEETRENFKPLMSKVQLQSELKKKHEEIQKEQDKLNQIAILKKQLEIKRKFYKSKKEEIIDTYRKVFQIYESMRNEFKKYENQLKDISLNILIGFNEQKFNDEVINGCLDKRDIKKIPDNSIKWKDEYQYQYESTKHVDFIKSIFNSVIKGEIKTKKNKEIKEAIIKLLENYFDLDFKISYKDDFLDKMSPGKKGLVLLRLLIDLSNEEWPILLDQPEDDLDNRSVYHDLVSFIKRKKKERQIIIVTHNPNLTVGADSEEVIVANQEGQERGRDNKQYKFEYVSGALENNFEEDSTKKSILLKKGIRQHTCEILEGGEEAFLKREQKYNFKQQ